MSPVEPSELAIRAAALYLPITIAVALALHRRPDRRRIGAVVLATAWNVAALFVVNLAAIRVGWWSFDVQSASVGGVPADLWFGWALLWGAVPLLVSIERLAPMGALLVAADLVLMPRGEPVVLLGSNWLVGEAIAVAVCLVPGLLLGRWTARREHVAARITLQMVAFSTLLYLVLPALVFTITGDGWEPLLARPRWHFVVAAVVAAPVAAIAIQAVREFAAHGGTPVPLDPPSTLVTTGPYAYVANPMQLGGSLLLAGWGVLLGSPAVVAAAAMAAVFSAGFAAWDEGRDLEARFGTSWQVYRGHVRVWLPSWTPYVTHPGEVWVAASCEPCDQVGSMLRGRDPVRLAVLPAENCPTALERITYQQDGSMVSGVAAIGRSLEHINLAWAVTSWIARLPGLQQLLQLVADAVGGGPRTIPRGAPWTSS